jgi:hypothetical protein
MGKTERLLLLEQELTKYVKALHEASTIIMDQGVSKYPIFVAHQDEMTLGIPVIEKSKVSGKWNFNASTLEEFVVKKIIHEDKVDHFKKNYKDPTEHICIFVLSELGAKFVYLPIYAKGK